MKPNKQDSRNSQRRLIERLSGWRLIAFLVSAALNLGLLVGLIVLPLFLDQARLLVVTAWVSASHAVFLIAVAGFRFPISAKLALGMAHATACLWALASIDLNGISRLEVATLYLIPMLTLMVTIGGVAVARLTGFHRSKRFSVADVLLLVTAFAVLFPLVLQLIPRSCFTDGISTKSLKSAFMAAAMTGITCLLVSNLYLNFIPARQQGLSPWMILVGWFLLAAMIDWNLCQFGFLVGIWILVSLIPIIGTAVESVGQRRVQS